MTDDEWLTFRAHYLSLHNVYIPDSDRPMYDAPTSAPEPRSGPPTQPATDGPPVPVAAEAEAPVASEEVATKPQPVFDLSQFIGGS
jgi:hypothetical protein